MRPTLQSTLQPTLLFLALTLSVAGCGYKGPLYLPETKPAAKKPVAKPVVSPASAPADSATAAPSPPAAAPQPQQTP